MEESKYYIPEIEEFCVGFEYEITSGYEWVKKSFCHEQFNTFLYQHLDNAINQQYVRVKFLDREDIESLGWKWIDKKNSGKNFYESTFENSTRGLMYFEHDWLNNKITIKSPNFIRDGSGRFDGFSVVIDRVVVKNKSELRKLMQMLQIK